MNDLYRVANLFDRLAVESGSNAKKALLKANSKDELFKEALRFFLDPMVVTGIADRKLQKDNRAVGHDVADLAELMAYLRKNNSGRDEDVGTVQRFVDAAATLQAKGFVSDLSRKRFEPSIGVDAKTANAAFGSDFMPEFEVMLADKWQDVPAEFWIGKKFCVQPKHDGHRVCAFKRNGVVTIIARGGKLVEGLVEIEEAVRKLPIDDVVLDGEKLPLGFQNMSNTEAFKLTSESTKKGAKGGMCLAVYDFMTTEDWDKRNCSVPYSMRYEAYCRLLEKANDPFLVPTYNLYEGSYTKEVIILLKEAKAEKKEGVMVKLLDGKYEWKRGTAIVKVKTMEDADLKVIGFNEGTGKHKGRLGAVVVEYKGNAVGVGSGFTDAMRTEIWKNKAAYLGRTLEVVYQDETMDRKTGLLSLRFPVAKTFKD